MTPQPGRIDLRQAGPRDAPAIAAIHADCWQAAYRNILPPEILRRFSRDRRLVLWRGLLAADSGPPPVIVAVTEEGACQGFVWLRRLPSGLAFDGEVIAIYVGRDQQRQGLGRRLMAAAAARLQALGAADCYLWVFAQNRPARRFYERLGGRLTDRGSERLEGIEIPTVAYAWRPVTALLQAGDG